MTVQRYQAFCEKVDEQYNEQFLKESLKAKMYCCRIPMIPKDMHKQNISVLGNLIIL